MSDASVSATVEPVTDPERVLRQWAALEPLCRASLFQSTAWLAPWLAAAAGRFEVSLVRAERDGTTVGLGLVVSRALKRRLLPVRTLFVNEAGPSEIDFCIEHNGFLLHRDHEQSALLAMVRSLCAAPSWDELRFRRAPRVGALHQLPSAALAEMGLQLRTDSPTVSPYVDLERVRAAGGYLAGLSGNRRGQIRRALRRLERYGPLAVEAARTRARAMAFLDGLKRYHQQYWEGRGEPGVFANPHWEAFHRKLIAEQLDGGGAQLLHITAGELSVGYIYSLVREGWVNMIQSGFNYDLDPKAHPGESCHVLAIEWNLERGHRAYDFLAGDMRYKRSLANDMVHLDGVVLQRRRWRFRLEDGLRSLYRRLPQRRAAAAE